MSREYWAHCRLFLQTCALLGLAIGIALGTPGCSKKDAEERETAAPQKAQAEPEEEEEGYAESCDLDSLIESKSPVFASVLQLAVAQEACREVSGSFVTLEQLTTEGCSGRVRGGEASVGPVRLSGPDDPRYSSDYNFHFSLDGNQLTIAMVPHSDWQVGIIYNGVRLFCKVGGEATSRDQMLGSPTQIMRRMTGQAK